MVSLTTILRIWARETELRIKIASRPKSIRETVLFMSRLSPSTLLLLLFIDHGRDFLGRWFGLGIAGACFAPSGKTGATGDQASAALVSEVRPRPLNEDEHAVLEPDQEKNVDEKPCQPGNETGDVNLAELSDRGGAANGGEAAFIVVVEVKIPALSQRTREGRGTLFQLSRDSLANEAAFLDRYRRHTGQHGSRDVLQRGEISDDEDFRMAGNAEIRLDKHASGAIDGDTQLFAER